MLKNLVVFLLVYCAVSSTAEKPTQVAESTCQKFLSLLGEVSKLDELRLALDVLEQDFTPPVVIAANVRAKPFVFSAIPKRKQLTGLFRKLATLVMLDERLRFILLTVNGELEEGPAKEMLHYFRNTLSVRTFPIKGFDREKHFDPHHALRCAGECSFRPRKVGDMGTLFLFKFRRGMEFMFFYKPTRDTFEALNVPLLYGVKQDGELLMVKYASPWTDWTPVRTRYGILEEQEMPEEKREWYMKPWELVIFGL